MRHLGRRSLLTSFALVIALVVGLFVANPANAAGVPYVNLYKDVNYGTLVWSGGGTGCFSLVGTSAMNTASSVTAHNLAQPIVGGYAYYRVDFFDHGDCTGYFGFSINGHNGDDQYFSSLVYYPCYCNDRISGVKIVRIS